MQKIPPLRILYGHGFASGPASSKGRALRDRLAARGRTLELLDLRVPDPEKLRLSAMIDVVRGASKEGERAIGVGSSLGGLTMARAAERDDRIVGVLLIAPAFRLVERWRARIGEEKWLQWQTRGTLAHDDHTRPGAVLNVDFGFMLDAQRIDDAPPWPNVRVPTTIVQGQRDDVVDPQLARTFAKGRANVKLVETDDDHQMLASIDVIERELQSLMDSL